VDFFPSNINTAVDACVLCFHYTILILVSSIKSETIHANIFPVFDTNVPPHVCSYILHGFPDGIIDATIGTGDTFKVVNTNWPSSSVSVTPTLQRTITHISGHIDTHVIFTFRHTSTKRLHKLYVPAASARITSWQRLMEWLCGIRYRNGAPSRIPPVAVTSCQMTA
jgi:hypothetical protein